MELVVAIGVALVIVAAYDLTQRRHAILRNFPIVGHLRYVLESVGPELRQYIVTKNTEERPFSRDQRRWVYASSKLENNYFGFGSDNEPESSPNYLVIKHSAFPVRSPYPGDADCDRDRFGSRTIAELFGERRRGLPASQERQMSIASRAAS